MLQEVGAVYQIDWAQLSQRKNTIAPIYDMLVAQWDNHVKAWLWWKKEQGRKQREHLRDLQRQDDLDAAIFREGQWQLLQNNKETARRAVIEKREWQEYETLVELLETLEEGPVRQVLMNMWSNIEMIWKVDGEMVLNHHGKVLTMEERNRLQHAANGNIKDIAKRWGHQAMTVRPYDRPKRQTDRKSTRLNSSHRR